MRDLLKLLRKYQVFILFVILQFFCFLLIFSYNSFPKATYLSSTNSIIGTAAKKVSGINEYFHLKEINEDLLEENTLLKESSKFAFKKLDKEFFMIDDSLWRKQYRFSYANVVQMSIYQKNNYITIDKGESASVEVGMGVLSTDGIVGKVIKCGRNYSLVMPVIHSQFTLNVIEDRTGSAGLLTWEDESDYRYAKVNNITNDTPLKVGDKFVSRIGSPLYPGDLAVGEIDEIVTTPGDNFHQIRIKLNTDFGKLKKVTLVYNLFKPELDELEKAIVEDE